MATASSSGQTRDLNQPFCVSKASAGQLWGGFPPPVSQVPLGRAEHNLSFPLLRKWEKTEYTKVGLTRTVPLLLHHHSHPGVEDEVNYHPANNGF